MAVGVNLSLFKNPPVENRPVMMWFWNGEIREDEIKRQLEGFLSQKIHQFFIHPMYGFESDYLSSDFFNKVGTAIDEAERLGMKYWFYDEYNSPSGVAGGYLIKDHPEYRSLALRCVIKELKGPGLVTSPFEGKLVKAFRTGAKGGVDVTNDIVIDKPNKKFSWRNSRGRAKFIAFFEEVTSELLPSEKWSPFTWGQNGYLDTLNPEAVKGFLNYTYEKYNQKFSGKFGTVLVGAFTDEPGTLSSIGRGQSSFPWTKEFLTRFKEEKGYNLADHLYELIIDTGNFLKTRYDYWRFVTDAFVNAYTLQISQWCESHEIKLTGHFLAEESITKGAFHSGDLFAHLKHFHQPGIDNALSKQTMHNDTASIAAKLGSSIAHQAGLDTLMGGAYSGNGWDLGMRDMKRIFDWLSVLGVNLTKYMGAYYSIKGFRKNENGSSSSAPSHSYQNSLWRHYGDFSDYGARVSYLNSLGSHLAPVAILYPTTTTWCEFDLTTTDPPDSGRDPKLWRSINNTFASLTNTLLELQWDYDYLFEEAFHEASVEKGMIKVKDEYYSVLILPSLTTLTEPIFNKIKKFIESGGEVLLVNLVPYQSPDSDDLNAKFHKLTGFNPESVKEEVYKLIGSRKPSSRLSRKGKVSLITTNEIDGCKRDGFYKKLNGYFSTKDKPFLLQPPKRNIRVLHRRIKKIDSFFVINIGSEPVKTRALISSPGIPRVLHPTTGEISQIDFKKVGKKIEVALDLPEYGSIFIQVQDSKAKSKSKKKTAKKTKTIVLDRRWSFRTEKNNMKRLRWVVSPVETDKKIAEVSDLSYREWKKPLIDDAFPSTGGFQPGSSFLAKAEFAIKDMLPALMFVIEKIEPLEMIINDYLVTDLRPYILWDESNVAAGIEDYLQKGINQIYIKTTVPTWEAPHTLPFSALSGDFSINRNGGLIKPLTELIVGSWTDQGFPDYSGTGIYSQQIEVKEETKRNVSQLGVEGCVDVIELWMNGRKVGKRLWSPYVFDLSGILRKGTNLVELRVTNTSENLLRRALPSGLLGGAKIVLY